MRSTIHLTFREDIAIAMIPIGKHKPYISLNSRPAERQTTTGIASVAVGSERYILRSLINWGLLHQWQLHNGHFCCITSHALPKPIVYLIICLLCHPLSLSAAAPTVAVEAPQYGQQNLSRIETRGPLHNRPITTTNITPLWQPPNTATTVCFEVGGHARSVSENIHRRYLRASLPTPQSLPTL